LPHRPPTSLPTTGCLDFQQQDFYILFPVGSCLDRGVHLKALVERKRSRRFADDDRLIGDYKIKDVNGEPRLWAEARSPYPKSA